MPKLKISAGPTRSSLKVVATNYDISSPCPLDSEHFKGKCTVRIRDFTGETGDGKKETRASTESDYFDTHTGLTWSIHIQGRFLEEVNANDVVFGNIFDKPIRDHLPYGMSAALKFVNYVDPALEQDIYGDKPWAFSPLIATMNHLQITALESAASEEPQWSSSQPAEDILPLYSDTETPASSDVQALKGNSTSRRSYFAKKDKREVVDFKPNHWLDMDFCNGYLDFNTFSLKLPGGLHFSLMKYWDGQPVTYVCKTRDDSREFFFIVFDIINEELVAKKDTGELAGARKEESEALKQVVEKEGASTGKDGEDDLGVD